MSLNDWKARIPSYASVYVFDCEQAAEACMCAKRAQGLVALQFAESGKHKVYAWYE